LLASGLHQIMNERMESIRQDVDAIHRLNTAIERESFLLLLLQGELPSSDPRLLERVETFLGSI
jgi:hypothetical protein